MPPDYADSPNPASRSGHAIRCAAAAVAVQLGEPVGYRLCRLVDALDFYGIGEFELAAAAARQAMLPLEQIDADQRNLSCALPFGAVLDRVRRLPSAH